MQFNVGDTRSVNGVTYQRQADGRWVPQGGGQGGQGRLVPVAPPKPGQDVDLARDQVGLARDRAALETAPYDARKAAADARKAELEVQAAERKAADPTGALGVEQSKATGFYSRALKANEAYEATGVGAEPVSRAVGRALLPEDAENFISSPERQTADANARAFIEAALRYDSGAAIPPEEYDNSYRTYFPQVGDSPEVIAAKVQLRRNVIDALKMGAGPGAAQVNAPVRLDDAAYMAELERLVREGDRAAIDRFMREQGASEKNPGEIDRAIAAGAGDVRPPEQAGSDVTLNLSEAAEDFGVGLRGLAHGAGDVLGLVGNPLNAGLNWAFGTNLSTDLGQTVADATGLPTPENDAERLGYQANRFGLGALGLSGPAGAAARYAPGAASNALSRFGAAPLTDATAGAVSGGASEAVRQADGGPALQAIAALLAGGATAAAGGRVNSLTQGTRSAPNSNALTTAGQQEGVTVNRAMIDPNTHQRVTAVGKTMVGGRQMQREMRDIGGQIEGRVRDLGDGGSVMEADVAGQNIQGAAERVIKTSGRRLGKVYDGLEKEVGSIKVPPTNSLQRVDEAITRLSEMGNTNSAEITFLNGLRDDLSKDLSVSSLRRLRTKLRKKISKGDLVFGEDEATVLSIMETAAEDVASGLRAAGKGGAAVRFRQIDKQYRDRMDYIKNTIQKVVGKRDANLPGGQVLANFRAMMGEKGNNAGFARLMADMTPEERADAAATFADALGKNNKGEFSTNTLLRNLEKMPPNVRAAAFGSEGKQSLDNLAILAKEHDRVSQALGGSPTGVANDYRSILLNFVFGGGAGIVTESGPTAAAVAAGGLAIKAGRDFMNARMLLNTDVQRWLRSAPKTASPKAINAHFDRLKVLATRYPALAEEIQQFQQAFVQAANDNAGQVSRSVAGNNEEQR